MWGWGRGWEIFTRNGVKPRMAGGLGFIMGGSFFNIVGRGVLTLLFHEKTPILPPSLFFKFCPPSSPLTHTFLPPPTPLPLFFLSSCFLGWMGDHATFDILIEHVEPWYRSTRKTWCVFYVTRRKVYWVPSQCSFLLLLWFDKHKHSNTNNTLSGQ